MLCYCTACFGRHLTPTLFHVEHHHHQHHKAIPQHMQQHKTPFRQKQPLSAGNDPFVRKKQTLFRRKRPLSAEVFWGKKVSFPTQRVVSGSRGGLLGLKRIVWGGKGSFGAERSRLGRKGGCFPRKGHFRGNGVFWGGRGRRGALDLLPPLPQRAAVTKALVDPPTGVLRGLRGEYPTSISQNEVLVKKDERTVAKTRFGAQKWSMHVGRYQCT